MKVIVLYATYSSGTMTAADFLTKTLKENGHQVEQKLISEINFDDCLPYDLRVFSSPSWDNEKASGQPHVDFISFMEKSAGKSFSGKNCAIFGLGDSTYEHFCGAVDIIEDFIKKSGGKLIVSSLRIDNYFFDMNGYNQKLAEWAVKLA
jgi:flavodoxin I